jgi:hypothetical protein
MGEVSLKNEKKTNHRQKIGKRKIEKLKKINEIIVKAYA